jgi:diguanylate cyclase (GGDEF)-like protein/PAS domain S-box-containing protein
MTEDLCQGPARRPAHPPARRPAQRLVEYASVPFSIAAFAGLRHLDLVADVPLWLLALAVLTAAAVSTAAHRRFPRGSGRARLHARVGLETAVITVCMYLTGWGPVLAVGYLFGAADNIDGDDGSHRPVLGWTLAGMATGQVLIARHLAPSMLPIRLAHGAAVLSAVGMVNAIVLMARHAREKQQAQETVRRSEQRMRSLVQHSFDAVSVVDLDGTVTYVSPGIERLLGHRPDHYIGRSGVEFVHPDQRVDGDDRLTRILGQPGATMRFETRARHRDGSWRWLELTVTNLLDDPSVAGIVCNLHDVTERKELVERLGRHAYSDALTGLPNRRSFIDRLESALAVATRDHHQLAVLFIDLDRFKLVNDSLGHEVGDRLLVDVTGRLRTVLGPTDVLARFGGDELTVLLHRVDDAAEAEAVAAALTDAMRLPFTADASEIFLTLSIGIVVSGGDPDDAGDLLREADLAMYLAKEQGRSRWHCYDPQTAPPLRERLELESQLWRALSNDELVLHYQPEVDLASGAVVAFEALVRWNHPNRGLLMPTDFIPFAEDSDLVVALDRHVVERALRDAADWQAVAGKLMPVSINLSPRSLRRPDGASGLLEQLRDARLDPRAVIFEITERTALAQDEQTARALHDLRALGVGIAIDDFGTGYSSLGYLREYPVNAIKLDRSFVGDLDRAAVDAAIVQAMITLGHALGARITAEGVEHVAQADRLRALGCDGAQGFHFAPPMTLDRVHELLLAGAPLLTPVA